jgi:hypothetical protein
MPKELSVTLSLPIPPGETGRGARIDGRDQGGQRQSIGLPDRARVRVQIVRAASDFAGRDLTPPQRRQCKHAWFRHQITNAAQRLD